MCSRCLNSLIRALTVNSGTNKMILEGYICSIVCTPQTHILWVPIKESPRQMVQVDEYPQHIFLRKNKFSFNYHQIPTLHMSRIMRKPAFCICENKDADQLRGNREADQRLCFRYIDSMIPLLSKSEISSL